MKKLGIFGLFFVLAIALVGCNGDDTPGEEECVNRADEGVVYNFDEQFTDQVELRVWLDDEGYFDELKKAFEAANPDIVLQFTEVGSVDVRQRLELYSGSPQAADVVVYPHDHIGAALQSGLLAGIEGSQAEDIRTRMVDSAWQTASTCYDFSDNSIIDCADENDPGTLFAAPLSAESAALFYNMDLMEDIFGITEAPETFEELFDLMDQYGDELPGEIMIGLDVGNAYDMHFAATAHGFQLFGEDGLDPRNPNLNSQAMIDALTWLNTEVRPNLTANYRSADLAGETNRTLFEEGNLPFIVDGPWSIQRYIDAEINFGVTKIPTINGVDPITFSGVQLASVYRQSNNPDAAFRLLEFMTSDEGLAILYEAKNVLPALKDVSTVEGVADDEYLSGISDQFNFSQPMPIIPEMGYFWSNAESMYGNAWNGVRTPENAAQIAQDGFLSQADLAE